MIIKPQPDRSHDITVLEELAALPNLTKEQRAAIEREIKIFKAGAAGESFAAQEIERLYGDTKNWAVIHDLRIEHNGSVAQIDHMIINRMMQAFVFETKNFREGLACNTEGEWVGFHKSRPFGIGSPILQNERHIDILKSALKPKHAWHPTRLGARINVDWHSIVLVSNTARISRPKRTNISGIETVVKIEALQKTVDRECDKLNTFLAVSGVVYPETLRAFAEGLAGLHVPHCTDWAARFGITAPKSPKKAKPHTCSDCSVDITLAEARFCWMRKERFGGKRLCKSCQANYAAS